MTVKEDWERAQVIEQLEKYGAKDNEGLTLNELRRKLAVARAMEVEVGNPGSGWF